MDYLSIHDRIICRALQRTTPEKHHKHHIVPRYLDAESTDVVLLTIKEHGIIHALRYKLYKNWQDKVAWRLLRYGKYDYDANFILRSNAGKLGGKTTRKNKSGIFNPDYDRSSQTKMNHLNGIYGEHRIQDYCDMGGKTTRKNKSGIFNPELQHKRIDWAKIGAKALEDSGNRRGAVTIEWQEENREIFIKNCSNAGKKGGKTTGSMYWWNNGIKNKRSFICPGEDWVRGQLMSDKKRKQLQSIAGHNRKALKK